MKRITTFILLLLCATAVFAQSPERFSYQAVVRDIYNMLVADAQVGVRVSILQGSADGNAVYVETHSATTNANGLLSVEIGGGTVLQGSFAGIDWADGPFFLKTETDPNGGNNYSIIATQQLLSVPYALYAKEVANNFSGDYNDLANRPQIPTNVSALNNDAGYITMDSVPTIPTNVSSFANDVPYLTEEHQMLSISNDTIFLTDGGFVKLPAGFDGDYNSLTNKPVIPVVPTNVSAYSNDAGYITIDSVPAIPVNVSAFNNDAGYITMDSVPAIPTNVSAFANDVPYLTVEQQILTISHDTIFLTGGSFVKLPEGFSGDYNDLTNAPAIPTVPTDVSAFNNDAGYVSMAQCSDVAICTLVNMVTELQQQLASLQTQLDSMGMIVDTAIVQPHFYCGISTVKDVDGNTYHSVQIGGQCWLNENLRTSKYADSTYIALGSGSSTTTAYRYYPNGDSSNVSTYGYLYNWKAIMHDSPSSNADPSGVQGLCPTGWHVPSDAEWTQLTDYMGNDVSVFGAFPAGSYDGNSYGNLGIVANFWSATEAAVGNAWSRSLYSDNANMSRDSINKSSGLSVRCLRD